MTDARFNRLKPDTIVLHPGPMIRGIEIDAGVADDPHHTAVFRYFQKFASHFGLAER